MNPAAVQIAAL